jgi:hypothetical protein
MTALRKYIIPKTNYEYKNKLAEGVGFEPFLPFGDQGYKGWIRHPAYRVPYFAGNLLQTPFTVFLRL